MRRTKQTLAVASALMADPHGTHWGYPLTKQVGLRSGVLYPILGRMLDEGWLSDAWEDARTIEGRGRPPRRYYELTERGIIALGGMLAEAPAARLGVAARIGYST